MGIKIFYNFKTAVEFLRHYDCARMNYEDMFKGAEVKRVEVKLKADRPESASFQFERTGKKDISNITF